MSDQPLFDITPRRAFKVGDIVTVETIIGDKQAVVLRLCRDCLLEVAWGYTDARGKWKQLAGRTRIDSARVK